MSLMHCAWRGFPNRAFGILIPMSAKVPAAFCPGVPAPHIAIYVFRVCEGTCAALGENRAHALGHEGRPMVLSKSNNGACSHAGDHRPRVYGSTHRNGPAESVGGRFFEGTLPPHQIIAGRR
jgi:hypothetical protein